MTMKKCIGVVLLAGLMSLGSFAQETSDPKEKTQKKEQQVKPVEKKGVLVSRAPVVPHLTPAVRDLPAAIAWRPGDPIKTIPRLRTHFVPSDILNQSRGGSEDPLLEAQRQADPIGVHVLNPVMLSFDGQGFSGVNPPDPAGDVGTSHYIQSINGSGGSLVHIYNKDGTSAASVFSMQDLGSGNCATGLGDPIILFDQAADRWMLSEFSNSGNQLCVYVSQTADPTGAYYAYAFTSVTSFPDYPKYGVWPDAYYVGTNEDTTNLYALDRANMLSGNPATLQSFSVAKLSGFGFQMVTPADLDGATAPPSGLPAPFLRHRDTESHGAGTCTNPGTMDCLEIFEFDVDWVTPANSSLSGPTTIEIAEIDSDLCGLTAFNCFAQPGSGTTLDPLREPTMFRNQYRNFGSHQTLVGNLTTDVSGSDQGGIRWFELRNTGSGWFLEQEGTVAPDGDNRFMGSASMDGTGNLAVAYNVTSTTTFPSLRYTGREAGDPAGTMPQGEFSIVGGTAANSSNRYGDYSALSLDPVDDATFWFTGEYNPASQWSTRIATFQFDQDPDYTLAVTPNSQGVCPPTDAQFTVDIGSKLGYTDNVSLLVSGNPAGTTAGFLSSNVTPPGSTTLTIGNTGAAAPGDYTITVSASSTSGNKSKDVTLTIYDTSLGTPTLMAPGDMATGVSGTPTLTWSAVSGVQNYFLEVDDDPAFGSVDYSATEATTSHMLATPLNALTTYYWRVRAQNPCDTGSYPTAFEFETANIICATFNSTDVPTALPDSGSVSSTLTIPTTGNITDLNVASLVGTHTYMGDLDFVLQSPLSTSVTILDTGSCGTNEDFDLSLDDESGGGTPPCPPVGGGDYVPTNALSGFDGEDATGTWTLTVNDSAGGDSGSLNQWSLYVCYSPLGEDFTIGALPASQDVCQGSDGDYTVNVGAISGFTGDVTLSSSGEPATTTVGFSPNPVSPSPGSSTMTISNTGGAALGTSTVTITGTGTPGVHSTTVDITIVGPLGTTSLTSPANGATGESLAPTLTWSAATNASNYDLQVATDAGFASVVYSTSVAGTSHTLLTPLNTCTTYYWRVRAVNGCGNGAYTASRNFITANGGGTLTFASSDVPLPLPEGGGTSGTTVSTVDVSGVSSVADLNILNLVGTHTWMGDLDFVLQSPLGTNVTFLDTGSCGNVDNFNLGLDDESANGASGCPPTSGTDQTPTNPLSGFDGEDPTGTWTMTITDAASSDSGQFDSWSLEITDSSGGACPSSTPSEPSAIGSGLPLLVVSAGNNAIEVEKVAGATAYNVFMDAIGDWYSPDNSGASVCTVSAWTDNGTTVTLDVTVPSGHWAVVSASNASGESSAGLDSSSAERTGTGTWPTCPLGP